VKYEVKLGAIKTPAGAILGNDWKAQFTATPGVTIAGKDLGYVPVAGRPRSIAMHPTYTSDVSSLETFAVLYDQPIDLATARSLVALTDAKKGHPSSIVVAHPATQTFQGVKVDPRFVVLVRPVSPIAGGTALKFEAKDFRSERSRWIDVSVAMPLALDEISCEWVWDHNGRDRPCSFDRNTLSLTGREIQVRFNHRSARTRCCRRSCRW
jgi:hypothetical protein